ncbi:MAG: hypothetical protein HZA31_11750 [Opitutae bacterium]|nr:hypothetical protein [Opitutae bacterium]
MKPHRFSFWSAILAALLLAGCSTVESRIKEHPAVFAALDAPTQQKIRQQIVELGYTPEMVYLALGAPSEKLQKTTEWGVEDVWIYNRYYRDWVGNVLSHYQRWVMYDPVSKRYIVYVEPVYANVYEDREEEQFRVTYLNGKVAVMEQVKDRGERPTAQPAPAPAAAPAAAPAKSSAPTVAVPTPAQSAG